MPSLPRSAIPPLLALGLALGTGAAFTLGRPTLPNATAASASTGSVSTGSGSGPQCTPQALNRSAILPGTHLVVSPLPDSYDASPETQISLLGVPAPQIGTVTVTGSVSGAHPGKLEAYSQGDGGSFMPTKPFASGETVTVRGSYHQGQASIPFAFRFTTSEPDPIGHADVWTQLPTPTAASLQTGPPAPSAAGSSPASTPSSGTTGPATTTGASTSPASTAPAVVPYMKFHSRPDLTPPVVTVDASQPGVAPGDVFIAPYSGPGQIGPMIFDNTGQLVWFDPLPPQVSATNLQVQQYLGQPVLTWWEGYITPQGFGQGEELIANSSYQVVDRVVAGNGYQADLHDFQLTPQGTALLTIFNPIRCNLSAFGGPANAAVSDGVFQEIDVKTGLVRREWHSLDHVSIGLTYSHPPNATLTFPLDYFHINSIDPSGVPKLLLLSSRNTWAVYEVDASSGQVIARIGGKESTYKMGSGTATAWQHDARGLPGGMISVFDNGAVPKVQPQSSGLVLALNPQTHTTTLVHQYTHTGGLSAGSQGNFQTLSNGDAFLGWGSEPYMSEFSATGQLLFDAELPAPYESYRAFRFAWSGQPTLPPAIAATSVKGKVTVYASWNGATTVASWQVLAGATPATLTPLTTAARSGFETTIALPGTNPGPDVEVQALGATGTVLGTSPVIKA